MAKVRSAASTDPDIEVEADATPTAPSKSKVLKMRGAKAAAAPPVPEKGAKKKAPKGDAPPKFLGTTTGMRIGAFQNQLMAKNFRAKLTDEQLAAAMRAEFPHAVAFTVAHVRGIRSQWNNGKHGNTAPEKPLPEFDDAGTPMLRGKAVAKKVKTEKVVEPPKTKKGKTAK